MALGKWVFVVVALIAGAALLLAWQGSMAGQATARYGTVRIGYMPISSDLAFFVALDRGYFASRGVTVEPVKFASSNLMAEALVRGDIDAAVSTASAPIYVAESKSPGAIKIAGFNAYGTGEDYLSEVLVSPNSSIATLAGLKGRKIATYPGTLALVYTQEFLRKNNVTDVEITQIDSGLQLQALKSGAVDALVAYEPVGTIGESQGVARKLFTAPFEKFVIDPWPGGAWIVNSNFLKSRPEAARAVIQSFYAGYADVEQEKSAANKYLANYTSIPASVAGRVPVTGLWNACQTDVSKIREDAAILKKIGVLTADVDPAAMLVGKELCE